MRRPFVTSLGRKTHSDNVLVLLRFSDGTEGWGEASSSLAMPWQTGPRLAAALHRLGRRFLGRKLGDLEIIVSESWRSEPETPTAAAAFECAFTDAFCRREGISVAAYFGGRRTELESLLSVSAVPPDVVGLRAAEGRRRGFRFLKLKLNGREPVAVDLARVAAAHRAHPKARLLLDANQSHRPDTLEELSAGLARRGIPVELVEEPFLKRRWSDLRAHRPRASFPILLDESVQTPADARKVFRDGLAAGVNVKIAKSGLLRSRQILDAFDPPSPAARRRPLFMIGCMCESPVGLAAAVHFALGTGRFHHADLDSDLLLAPTGARGGYVRRGPWLSLPKRPPAGLGVRP